MFNPGDSVIVVQPFKARLYDQKKWKKSGNGNFKVGATGVCIGSGKFVIQYGPFKSVAWGVELTESEASTRLVKAN